MAFDAFARSCSVLSLQRIHMTRRIVISMVLLVGFLASCRPASEPANPVQARDPETPANAGTAAASRSTDRRPAPTESPGDSSGPNPQEEADRRDMLGLADTIARHGDADALSLAALMRTSALPQRRAEAEDSPDHLPKMDRTVREWLDAAERQAPDDVVALILAIDLEHFDEARRQALIARWRALEPRNLVPILLAQRPGAEMFEAASGATVYDTHYDDVLRTIFRTVSRTMSPTVLRAQARRAGMSPEAFPASVAMGYRAAESMPWFPQLTNLCLPERVPEPLRAQCVGVARVMLDRGDDLMSEVLGAQIVARHAATAAARRDAGERIRAGRWLSLQSGNAEMSDPQRSLERLADALGGDGAFTEQAWMRQLVVKAGYSSTPPPGWQPGQSP